jgi:hypothetical protein
MDDTVDNVVFNGSREVLILFLSVIEFIEFLVSDSIDVDMLGGRSLGCLK